MSFRTIILLFISAIAVLSGMKAFGFMQVKELYVSDLTVSRFRIYGDDAIVSDYELLDCWYREDSTFLVMGYYHLSLPDGNIISLRIPENLAKGGAFKRPLRGTPRELTDVENERELKIKEKSELLLEVRHGKAFYIAKGIIMHVIALIAFVFFIRSIWNYREVDGNSPASDEVSDEE